METNSCNETPPGTTAGDWDKWEARWNAASEGGSTLNYTEETPQTINQFWQRCYFEDLWSLLPECDGPPNCLELGAGRATTSTYLASRGCRITLVDFSLTGLQLAKENFAACNFPEPTAVIADAQQTGLPAESYDCVHNIGLLEHFVDPQPILAESLRLLRPGGLLFNVIVPPLRRWHTWPVRLPINPLGLAFDTAVQAKHRVFGRRTKKRSLESIRTDYSRRQWLQWMAELGQPQAECVPYNPYHVVYRNEKLNSMICLPLYRMFHRSKKKLGMGQIALRTWPCFSALHLLICVKT